MEIWPSHFSHREQKFTGHRAYIINRQVVDQSRIEFRFEFPSQCKQAKSKLP